MYERPHKISPALSNMFQKNSQYEAMINCQKYPKLKLIANFSTQMECLCAYSYTIYIMQQIQETGERANNNQMCNFKEC